MRLRRTFNARSVSRPSFKLAESLRWKSMQRISIAKACWSVSPCGNLRFWTWTLVHSDQVMSFYTHLISHSLSSTKNSRIFAGLTIDCLSPFFDTFHSHFTFVDISLLFFWNARVWLVLTSTAFSWILNPTWPELPKKCSCKNMVCILVVSSCLHYWIVNESYRTWLQDLSIWLFFLKKKWT